MTEVLRIRSIVAVLAFATVLCASSAAIAADDPVSSADLGRIVGLVRWSGVVVSSFVLVGAFIALRILRGVVDRLSTRFTHRRLVVQQTGSIVRFLVYFVTGTVCIALSFQVNQTIITLIGGTLAVAVGFALRDLVAAIIAGITIMLDRPFQVGDRVQYAGEYGDITAIGLRSVRMQTLDDNTVTIPNNKVLTDVTSCGNYGALDMQVAVDFYVAVDQDIAAAERILIEAMLSSRFVYLDKPVAVVLKQVVLDGLLAIHMRAKGYVLDTKYEKAFESDVTRSVLAAFRTENVLPPTRNVRVLDSAAAA